MSRYNVAIRFKENAGVNNGNFFWTSFNSKKDFDKWYSPKVRDKLEILGEDISIDQCFELTHKKRGVIKKLTNLFCKPK